MELFRLARPEIPADGEMQADTAVMPELMKDRRPDGALDRAANVLVFPNLTAANASYKLLNRLGDAEVIGPILSGLSKTVHVLQRDASVYDVVNMTAIAVADAQRRERAGRSGRSGDCSLISATSFFSTAGVHSTIANTTGHIGPSSSVAASSNPNIVSGHRT